MNEKIFHNRYKILEKVGSGGTSVVFKAEDMVLNRLVTIKILRDQYACDEEFVKRFKNEAQSVARLSHPNIVRIYDVVFTESSHYLVMEYVDGCSLKEYIEQNGPLDIALAVRVERQILSALQHAHENNVIHRDIKPHNILLDQNLQVKVTDFGIAVAVSDVTETSSRDIVGSVHYMAPEQVQGEKASEKTDVYSAAVVFYEMLTGKKPFEGDNAMGIAMQHVQNEVEPPHKLNDKIPLELSAIIMRALRKNDASRYNSAQEMSEAIAKVDLAYMKVMPNLEWKTVEQLRLEEEAKAKAEAQHEGSKKSGKQVRQLVIILFAVVVLLLIGAAVILHGGNDNRGEVIVPDVVGMQFEEAQKLLEENNLTYSIDRRMNDLVEADHVISQGIAAEQSVKEGRLIALVVSDGPNKITVPDVVGLSQREAEILIQNRMLSVEVVEETDSDTAFGSVISQEPLAGTKVIADTMITIKISKGKEVAVPNVQYITLEQARAALAAVNLTIGSVTQKESSEYVENIVIAQAVAAETVLTEGSSVDLTVSSGPGPVAQKARVTYTLPLSGDIHVVRIVVTDDTGSHEEYNSAHKSGDSIIEDVPFYGSGKIQIYLDDEPVFSQNV